MWIPFVVVFVIDTPMRETSIFLLPVAFAIFAYSASVRKKFGLGAVGLGLLLYAGIVRVLIQHRFQANPNVAGSYLNKNLDMLSVFHWPQLFSAGGYFALFVFLQRWRLSPKERVFLWACLACVPITLYFGVWVETRIWLEWTLPLALLGSAEWSSYMDDRRSGQHLYASS
jgi:hypothetical protein